MTRFGLVAMLLVLGARQASAYSLLGPIGAEAYQVAAIGYNIGPGQGSIVQDLATPRNFAEEYRWNTPYLYYAYDANFLSFFGTTGAAESDKAFAILNNTLSNVSTYSSNLTEWPLLTKRVNFRAEALLLWDLKSLVLQHLVEELGLGEPERWAWALRTRAVQQCPNVSYTVVQRNYDPTTGLYSPYVNGTLYGYQIIENCALNPNPFAPLLADAVEYPADPFSQTMTSVASMAGLVPGVFYTGLTRDDVGGVRYLFSKSNLNVEPAGVGNLLIVTNAQSFSQLVTSNLADLLSASLTNSGDQLEALFPGLIVTSSTFVGFSNVVTTTTGGFFTPNPFAPAGSPPIFQITSGLATNFLPVFTNTFGNVLILSTNNQQTAIAQSTAVGGNPFGPPGSLTTNTNVTTTIIPNVPGGEYILIPANQCGFSIIGTNFTTLVTNITGTITNIIGGNTNTSIVGSVFTSHTLTISVPTCVAGNVALRQGMEKIRFFRQDFDSLLGQFWAPVTNTFTLNSVTNNTIITQFFSRTITVPDILLSSLDQNTGALNTRTAPIFARANAGNGLGGPGIIQDGFGITLNQLLPFFSASGSATTVGSDLTASLGSGWGSFDGSTNTPIVYPNAASIADLENQIFLQITVAGLLPIGKRFQFYTTTLTATGIELPPYTWSLATNSPALPPGLTLNSGSGVISGVPTTAGIFDFIVKVADTTGRSSQRNFAIQINP